LCAFGALGYGGWQLGGPIWLSILGTVVLGVGGVTIWGLWVAPRASYPLPDPQRLIPEWVVFGGATVALAVTGHLIPAIVFAVLAALNRVALWRLHTGTGGESTGERAKDESGERAKDESRERAKDESGE
jgi:hypothetical protein